MYVCPLAFLQIIKVCIQNSYSLSIILSVYHNIRENDQNQNLLALCPPLHCTLHRKLTTFTHLEYIYMIKYSLN